MLKVLVIGSNEGACSYYRSNMFEPYMESCGVTMRHINGLEKQGIGISADGKTTPLDDLPTDELRTLLGRSDTRLELDVDGEPLAWADVILFRRHYNTFFACPLDVGVCDFRTTNRAEALAHLHGIRTRANGTQRDTITKIIWDIVSTTRDKAIVYDSDDLLIGGQMRWNGLWADFWAARDLCKDMARGADLVTVSTPYLAKRYGLLNPNVRVVRNAVEPSRYVPTQDRQNPKTTMVYYGSAVRMRDYAGYADEKDGRFRTTESGTVAGKWKGGYAHKAVLDLRRDLRTVFIGAEDRAVNDVRPFFDAVIPHVSTVEGFASTLANEHPDIGIAPLWGDEFDYAKSELHWLEYSMVGAATVAERLRGESPYSVIRDGVDGLLVSGRQGWYDGLRKLIREPAMRIEMAAAARERVLRDYNPAMRAQEWADAFTWAAEHRGVGR